MPTSVTCKAKLSGNHGSSQPDNRASAPTESAPVISHERKESSIRFVAPIKKSPSIKEVMAEPVPQKEEQPAPKVETKEQPAPELPKAEAPAVEQPAAEPVKPEIKEENVEVEEEAPSVMVEPAEDDVVFEDDTDDDDDDVLDVGTESTDPMPEAAPVEVKDEYTQHWNTMLDIVFAEHPSVQSPLRDMPPEIVDNVMKIKVSGAIQRRTLEMKRRDMLEYFRNNYREDIDDIEVTVDEKVETKKVIYGNEDKLKYQLQQNQALESFMASLDLKLL